MKQRTEDILCVVFVVVVLFYALSEFWRYRNLAKYRETQRDPLSLTRALRWQTNGGPEVLTTGKFETVPQPHWDTTNSSFVHPTEIQITWSTSHTKPPVLELTNNFIYLNGNWLIRVNDEQWSLITNHYRDKAEINPPKTTISFR